MSDTLTEGQKLVRGESLASSNGAYTLTLQDDGNLVLASRGQPLWATSTTGQDVVRAEVQRVHGVALSPEVRIVGAP